MERRPVTGVIEPNWVAYSHELLAGKRCRLLLSYQGKQRSLVWLDIRPDSSVVMGLGMRADRMERRAHRRASNEPLSVKLEASLGESDVPRGFHLTFHASGIIHSGGPRTYRAPPTRPGPHQLCAIDFAHPSLFEAVQPRPQDVILPYRLQEDTAVRGCVTVAPEGAAAFFAGVRVQTAVVLRCLNRDGSTVLYLQVSLLQRDSGWSADTNITWASQDAQKHGFKERPGDG